MSMARLVVTAVLVEGRSKSEDRVEALLFRVGQEAHRNVMAHADAQNVCVRVAREDDRLVLTVDDDGRGFDPDRVPPAADIFGLAMLDGLAREAGGGVAVESRAGEGTRVRVEIAL